MGTKMDKAELPPYLVSWGITKGENRFFTPWKLSTITCAFHAGTFHGLRTHCRNGVIRFQQKGNQTEVSVDWLRNSNSHFPGLALHWLPHETCQSILGHMLHLLQIMDLSFHPRLFFPTWFSGPTTKSKENKPPDPTPAQCAPLLAHRSRFWKAGRTSHGPVWPSANFSRSSWPLFWISELPLLMAASMMSTATGSCNLALPSRLSAKFPKAWKAHLCTPTLVVWFCMDSKMTWSASRLRNLKTFWCFVVNFVSATQPSFCTASLLQCFLMALKMAAAAPSRSMSLSSFSGRFNAKFFKHHTACSWTSGLDKCASMTHKMASIHLAGVTSAGSWEICPGRTWRFTRSQVWAATCENSWPSIMRSISFFTSQPLCIVKGTVAATYNGIFASQESQMFCASSERQSVTATKSWLGSWWEQKQRRITSKGHWITLEARNSRRAKPCSSHNPGTPLPNALAIQIAATDSAQWRTACNSTLTSDHWDLESWTCRFSLTQFNVSDVSLQERAQRVNSSRPRPHRAELGLCTEVDSGCFSSFFSPYLPYVKTICPSFPHIAFMFLKQHKMQT